MSFFDSLKNNLESQIEKNKKSTAQNVRQRLRGMSDDEVRRLYSNRYSNNFSDNEYAMEYLEKEYRRREL